jgi:hypothetical protein
MVERVDLSAPWMILHARPNHMEQLFPNAPGLKRITENVPASVHVVCWRMAAMVLLSESLYLSELHKYNCFNGRSPRDYSTVRRLMDVWTIQDIPRLQAYIDDQGAMLW